MTLACWLQYIHGPARAYKYPKSKSTRIFLDAVMGEGLITVEGEKHRRERRIISPAVSWRSFVRALLPLPAPQRAVLLTLLAGSSPTPPCASCSR